MAITDTDLAIVHNGSNNTKVTLQQLRKYVEDHTTIGDTGNIDDTDFLLISDAAGNNYKVTALTFQTDIENLITSAASTNIQDTDFFLISTSAGVNHKVQANKLADYLAFASYSWFCDPSTPNGFIRVPAYTEGNPEWQTGGFFDPTAPPAHLTNTAHPHNALSAWMVGTTWGLTVIPKPLVDPQNTAGVVRNDWEPRDVFAYFYPNTAASGGWRSKQSGSEISVTNILQVGGSYYFAGNNSRDGKSYLATDLAISGGQLEIKECNVTGSGAGVNTNGFTNLQFDSTTNRIYAIGIDGRVRVSTVAPSLFAAWTNASSLPGLGTNGYAMIAHNNVIVVGYTGIGSSTYGTGTWETHQAAVSGNNGTSWAKVGFDNGEPGDNGLWSQLQARTAAIITSGGQDYYVLGGTTGPSTGGGTGANEALLQVCPTSANPGNKNNWQRVKGPGYGGAGGNGTVGSGGGPGNQLAGNTYLKIMQDPSTGNIFLICDGKAGPTGDIFANKMNSKVWMHTDLFDDYGWTDLGFLGCGAAENARGGVFMGGAYVDNGEMMIPSSDATTARFSRLYYWS